MMTVNAARLSDKVSTLKIIIKQAKVIDLELGQLRCRLREGTEEWRGQALREHVCLTIF